jgi:hypothetical protein
MLLEISAMSGRWFCSIVRLFYWVTLEAAANREGQRAASNMRHLPAFRAV